jgi:hypothetical protein
MASMTVADRDACACGGIENANLPYAAAARLFPGLLCSNTSIYLPPIIELYAKHKTTKNREPFGISMKIDAMLLGCSV